MLFIVKPTSACNGACVYCSAHQQDPRARGRMTLERLATLLGRIEAWAVKARPRRLALLWHGGEPLLMGAAFYREVLRHTAEIEGRSGIRVNHIMQSNLTLVDDELAEVLGELLENRRLGSSYDPIPGIRVLQSGESYEERWRAGYETLRRHGLAAGVVYVVHRKAVGRAREIYRAFREMDYDGGLRFNPLYAAGLARQDESLHITPRQWGEFLIELWEAWREDGRTLRVDPLQGWEQLAHGRQARIACAFSGRCTQAFTGVKSDGTVYSCGRSMDDGLLPFGNLDETDLEVLLRVEERRTFLNRVEWLQQGECAGCRWWTFCHGGCPNDAHLAYGDLLRRTCWCESRKMFLEHAYGELLLPRVAPEPEDHEDLFGGPGDDEPRRGAPAGDDGDGGGGEAGDGEEPR